MARQHRSGLVEGGGGEAVFIEYPARICDILLESENTAEEIMLRIKAIFLLPALLSIGAVQAAPPKTGQWETKCMHAEISGWKMCGVIYRAVLPDAGTQTHVMLMITAQRSGEARVSVSARATDGKYRENSLCFYRENSLEIDGVGVEGLESDFSFHSFYLTHAATPAVIDGFLTGDSVILTLHILPDCTSRDLPVSLEEFSAAWGKIEEELR